MSLSLEHARDAWSVFHHNSHNFVCIEYHKIGPLPKISRVCPSFHHIAWKPSEQHCRHSSFLAPLNMFTDIEHCTSFPGFTKIKHLMKLLILLCHQPIYLWFTPTHHICIVYFFNFLNLRNSILIIFREEFDADPIFQYDAKDYSRLLVMNISMSTIHPVLHYCSNCSPMLIYCSWYLFRFSPEFISQWSFCCCFTLFIYHFHKLCICWN